MDDATREHWLSKDRWSEQEFGELCCGMAPGGPRPRERQADLQEAEDAIKQAASSQTISHIFSPSASGADRRYGTVRFYLPVDVVMWAASKFAAFPFGEGDLARVAKYSTGLTARPEYKPSIEARRAYWFDFPDWSEHQALCLVVDLDPDTMDYLNSGVWDGVSGFDVEKAKSQFMQKYAAYTRPVLRTIMQKMGQKAYQKEYANQMLPKETWLGLFARVGVELPGIGETSSRKDRFARVLDEEKKKNPRGALARAAERVGVTRQRFRQLVPLAITGKSPCRSTK